MDPFKGDPILIKPPEAPLLSLPRLGFRLWVLGISGTKRSKVLLSLVLEWPRYQ